MRNNKDIKIYDFDMYSNTLNFFLDNKKRIGSFLGLFLTFIYILAALVILIIYSIKVLERKYIRVNDSVIFSNSTPEIEINSDNFNLAFGVENPKTSNRFIDPTIYYPEIEYIKRVRNENGEFETVEKKEMKSINCKINSFGNYSKNILGELNNSYCLEDFNFNLTGGYKYNIMSYIRIKIFPCSNKTKGITCKPKEVIDSYLNKGYFSILLEDIGLNPSNYSVPVLPIFQNLYTTIDSRIYRDFILYLGITEILTDSGLFYEIINKEKYLKFNNELESFYFRDTNEYNEGEELCNLQIRLDDIIHIQQRDYVKFPEIFSLMGGYMQFLSTIFSLISMLTNLDLELKILNNLFNFNLKQNRITIKINNIKDFNAIKHKNHGHPHYASKKSLLLRKSRNLKLLNNGNTNINNNNSINSVTNKNLIGKDNNSCIKILPIINKNSGNSEEINNMSIENNKKSLFYNKNNCNNNNKDNGLNKRAKSLKIDEKIYFRPLPMITNSFERGKNEEYKEDAEKYNNIMDVNIFSYYCCGTFYKRKEKELFDLGVSLYRKRMDIVNIFTIILLSEKILLKIERQQNSVNNKGFESSTFLDKNILQNL